MFKHFFKRRKMRATAFGEPTIKWVSGHSTLYSVVFYENDNGKRKYTVECQNYIGNFSSTLQHIHCETWKRTGLLPDWAKDPLAEKLSR